MSAVAIRRATIFLNCLTLTSYAWGVTGWDQCLGPTIIRKTPSGSVLSVTAEKPGKFGSHFSKAPNRAPKVVLRSIIGGDGYRWSAFGGVSRSFIDLAAIAIPPDELPPARTIEGIRMSPLPKFGGIGDGSSGTLHPDALRPIRTHTEKKYASESSGWYRIFTVPTGLPLSSDCKHSAEGIRDTRAAFRLATCASEIACSRSENTNNPASPISSPATPKITINSKARSLAFHLVDFNDSPTNPTTSNNPNKRTTSSDMWSAEDVADFDNGRSVPMSPYYLAVEMVLIAHCRFFICIRDASPLEPFYQSVRCKSIGIQRTPNDAW